MDHLARKTSISLTTRPKALKDVSITNTFTISLSSSMQACKAKESLLQEHLLLGLLRASYYQNFSILAAWQTLQHWWQQTANQSRRRQPHKKCVDKWKRAKVFLTLHSLKFLRRAKRRRRRTRCSFSKCIARHGHLSHTLSLQSSTQEWRWATAKSAQLFGQAEIGR